MRLTLALTALVLITGSALAGGRIYGTCDPDTMDAEYYIVDVYLEEEPYWMCSDSVGINETWKSDSLPNDSYRCYCVIYDDHGSALDNMSHGDVRIFNGNTECNFDFGDVLLELVTETWASIKTLSE
ncbi:MAG: hypothetical protein R6U36_08400 [Candidatus Fermentibacteraceae bacterium]